MGHTTDCSSSVKTKENILLHHKPPERTARLIATANVNEKKMAVEFCLTKKVKKKKI